MIKLGDNVKDSLTGLSGHATAVTEYLYGCKRICMEYLDKKSGEIKETWFFDQRLTTKSGAPLGGSYKSAIKSSNPGGRH